MNAIEQAKNLRLISKIEAIAHLFVSEFPDCRVDFKPWRKDTETARYIDLDSIDLGFHFNQLNLGCQCISILMQVRLSKDVSEKLVTAIGIELSGYENAEQLWRFSTIDNWQFLGSFPPAIISQEKLKLVCLQIIKLFESK